MSRGTPRRILDQILSCAALALSLVSLIAGCADVPDGELLGNTTERDDRQSVASPANIVVSDPSRDWPQWRGPDRDGLAHGHGFLNDWPEEGPRLLWKKRTTGPGYSGLAVVGGRLYTLMQDGDDEAVVCWNAKTGDELWRFRYLAKFVSDQGSGPRSTPTVNGDRVYTVGATAILHCLDVGTGQPIWRRDLIEMGGRIPDWGTSFSPLVDGDLVFAHPGGPEGNSLAAFDKHTGKLRWKALNDRPGYASLIISTAAGVRQVLFLTGEALVSVNPEDGRLYWRYPWETMMDCNVATPIVAGDYVFLSSGYGHGCALLKIVPKGSGALTVERVYAHTEMSNHFSTSVLYEGHLYGFDDARLVCMELETGKVLWRTRGFRKGSLLVADDHLIILGENGELALAEATPARYGEKASFRVSRSRCWTMPALAGGKLYIRDQEQIVCLDLVNRE